MHNRSALIFLFPLGVAKTYGLRRGEGGGVHDRSALIFLFPLGVAKTYGLWQGGECTIDLL